MQSRSDINGRFKVSIADADLDSGVDLTDGSSSLYVWGYNRNRHPMAPAIDTFATTYVPTTNAAVYQHRLDHDKDGNRIGLLVEEARTNKCLQSQALGTTWTVPGSNTTITDNAATAPDGTTTADDVKHGDSAETIQQTIMITDNTVVAISAFVKQGTTGSHDWVKLEWMDDSDATNGFEAWFNISTPAVGSTPAATGTGSYTAGSAKIEDYGNGWYRISAAGQIVSGQTDGRFVLINTTADNVETAEATNSVFWWGLMVEEGQNASPLSSYIPTTTVTVTRAVEVVTILVSAFGWNDTGDGAMITVATKDGLGKVAWLWQVDNDTNNNVVRNNIEANGRPRLTATGGSLEFQNTFSTAITAGVQFKVASSWTDNNGSITFDGNTVETDTTGDVPSGLTHLRVGARGNDNTFNGHIKSLVYYAVDLSDADLVAGTT